jgi:hypothetical protein
MATDTQRPDRRRQPVQQVILDSPEFQNCAGRASRSLRTGSTPTGTHSLTSLRTRSRPARRCSDGAPGNSAAIQFADAGRARLIRDHLGCPHRASWLGPIRAGRTALRAFLLSGSGRRWPGLAGRDWCRRQQGAGADSAAGCRRDLAVPDASHVRVLLRHLDVFDH